jgi:hypothetical protein
VGHPGAALVDGGIDFGVAGALEEMFALAEGEIEFSNARARLRRQRSAAMAWARSSSRTPTEARLSRMPSQCFLLGLHGSSEIYCV